MISFQPILFLCQITIMTELNSISSLPIFKHLNIVWENRKTLMSGKGEPRLRQVRCLGHDCESEGFPKFCTLNTSLASSSPSLLSGLTLNSWPQIQRVQSTLFCSTFTLHRWVHFPMLDDGLFHVSHTQHLPPSLQLVSYLLTEEKQQSDKTLSSLHHKTYELPASTLILISLLLGTCPSSHRHALPLVQGPQGLLSVHRYLTGISSSFDINRFRLSIVFHSVNKWVLITLTLKKKAKQKTHY